MIQDSQCKFFVNLLHNPEVTMVAFKLHIRPSQRNFRQIFTMKTVTSGGQDVRVLTLRWIQFLFSYILVLLYYKIREVELLSSEHRHQRETKSQRRQWLLANSIQELYKFNSHNTMKGECLSYE